MYYINSKGWPYFSSIRLNKYIVVSYGPVTVEYAKSSIIKSYFRDGK